MTGNFQGALSRGINNIWLNVINKLDNNKELVEKIAEILKPNTGVMAKAIGNKLGIDKSDLNPFLHHRSDLYYQDKKSYEWYLVQPKELVINFPKVSWLNADLFEEALKAAGSPLDDDAQRIIFVVAKKCSILLDAASRLLSLCNQLIKQGKCVAIDFNACAPTLHYFNRIGFCDLLSSAVDILPSRPNLSRAKTYKGNNENLTEFGEIEPTNPDAAVPEELRDTFISHAGKQYSTLALTVISEPYNNVHDHSKSPIPGFAALQLYNGSKKHIQTVISDSGVGIAGSLRPILKEKYSALSKKFSPQSSLNDILLIKEVFEKGGISQVDDNERGLGLKRTHDLAVKYTANLSIRQEFFELKLFYSGGKLKKFSYTENMPRIMGTHVCFDFFLD